MNGSPLLFHTATLLDDVLCARTGWVVQTKLALVGRGNVTGPLEAAPAPAATRQGRRSAHVTRGTLAGAGSIDLPALPGRSLALPSRGLALPSRGFALPGRGLALLGRLPAPMSLPPLRCLDPYNVLSRFLWSCHDNVFTWRFRFYFCAVNFRGRGRAAKSPDGVGRRHTCTRH